MSVPVKRPPGKKVAALDKNTVILLYASSTIFSKATKDGNYAFSSSNISSSSNCIQVVSNSSSITS